MPDILEIAMKRHAELKTEVTKLEAFLKMAEELSSRSEPEESLVLARSASAAVTPKPVAIERPRHATNGAAGA